jgi:hypothetical protein
MSTSHSLMRVLSEFEARVHELTAALALAGAQGSPYAASPTRAQPRAMASRMAAARALWFVAPVPMEAFLRAGNRMAIVAAHALRPMLAARALFSCRDAIRRCIDRETRRSLTLSVGPTALAALQERMSICATAEALPHDLSVDALARRGWALMLADGVCANATLRHVVELGLVCAAGGDVWQRALTLREAPSVRETVSSRVDAPRTDGANTASAAHATTDTDAFLSIAGLLFPEFQWLFG